MKNIHVIATSERRIITVAINSDVQRILKPNETVKKEWFYNQPDELNSFFKSNPNTIDLFLKGFSYWIEAKIKGFVEKKNEYEKLKRTIKAFNEILFEKIRGLATRIAKQAKKIIKSKRAIYDEERKQKKIYRRLTCQPM